MIPLLASNTVSVINNENNNLVLGSGIAEILMVYAHGEKVWEKIKFYKIINTWKMFPA